MLVVLNRSKSTDAEVKVSSYLDQGLHLETCLRNTVLLTGVQYESLLLDDPKLTSGFAVHTGYGAIEYLVKVLSGLESPIVGETEVLGQFKKQILPQLSKNSALTEVIQFVLNLVKVVRTKHLVGLGSQSYGSMVRRILKGHQHILFVGSGVLTESILPWVTTSKNVMISVRSLDRYKTTDVYKENKKLKAFSMSDEFKFDFPLNVVVCAPVEASVLEEYLRDSNVENLIDLREESKTDPVKGLNCKVVNLEKVFEEVKTGKDKKDKLIKNIEDDISTKIEERFVKHRPFGWEDLCL
jgi:glutamyl-tRNA reductase